MKDRPSIEELLLRWQKEHLPPEELCRDWPDLLDELRRHIAALEAAQASPREGESQTPREDAAAAPRAPTADFTGRQPPPTASRVDDLLARWQTLRALGQTTTAEEMCKDCPELLDLVKQQFGSTLDHTVDYLPAPKPDDAAASATPEVEDDRIGNTNDESARDRGGPAGSSPGRPAGGQGGGIGGRYRLERQIGQGGFAQVWRAFDLLLQRVVAVKKPRPDRPLPPAWVESFLAEARNVAPLKHAGIVPVYDVSRDGDGWFIVSELIDGSSLADVLARGKPPVEETARIVAEVAEALHHAHLNGLVHRDVKPGNILLDKKHRAYLTDFGLAVSEDELLGEKALISGTPGYMAPEQVQGQSNLVNPRTDIYSLGVVLYELLTGRRMFRAKSVSEYAEQILHREPRPPRTIDDAMPAELERICLKCLAKSVADRYTTAKDLASELRVWLAAQKQPAALPEKRTRKLPPRWRAAATLLFLVALVALATWVLIEQPWKVTSLPKPDTTNGTKPDTKGPDHPIDPAWQLLFQRPKDQFPWLLGLVPDKWDAFSDEQKFTIATNKPGLLKLGDIPAMDFEFHIKVEPLDWANRTSIFFGFHDETDKGVKSKQSQFITLQAVDKPGGREYQILREKVMHVPFVGTVQPLFEVMDTILSPDSLEKNLEIRVDQKGIKYIKWDGKPIPALVAEKANGLFPARYYTGSFGIYVGRNTVFFREAKLKTVFTK